MPYLPIKLRPSDPTNGTPVACSRNGSIVWIVGSSAAEKFLPSPVILGPTPRTDIPTGSFNTMSLQCNDTGTVLYGIGDVDIPTWKDGLWLNDAYSELGLPVGAQFGNVSYTVSNGSIGAGNMHLLASPFQNAYLWDTTNLWRQLPAPLIAPDPFSTVRCIARDTTIITNVVTVGESHDGLGLNFPTKWVEVTGTILPLPGGHNIGVANFVNGAGTVKVGWSSNNADPTSVRPCMWNIADSVTQLPTLGEVGQAFIISRMGDVVGGTVTDPVTGNAQAAMWKNGVLTRLPSQGMISVINAMSDNGLVIIGYLQDTVTGKFYGAKWVHGELGVLLSFGKGSLARATLVSGDGSKIYGIADDSVNLFPVTWSPFDNRTTFTRNLGFWRPDPVSQGTR